MPQELLPPAAVAEHDGPEGRRLQIGATRFRLDDGVAWVYLVEDVKTRQSVASTLSRERAAATLLEGHQRLMALGLAGPRLVQSDGGSDCVPPATSSRSARASDSGSIVAWLRSAAWVSWSA